MNLSNADYDLADQRAEQERAAGVARARAELTAGAGSPFCVECDEVIEPARRRAMPHADRCVGCQRQRERKS